MKKLIYSCTILALLSVVWFSCRKAITIDDSDRDFPIQLTATIEGDSVVLSWNMERTVQFQRIIVVRTPAPFDKGLSPFILPDVKFILDAETDGIERFAELLPLFQPKSYYKVYVLIDGRFIESNIASISRNIFIEGGRPEMILMHPDSNWAALFIIFDNKPPAIVIVDLNDGKIKGKHEVSGSFAWLNTSMSFQRYQGKEYLVVIVGYFTQYLRLDLPFLNLTEEKMIPYSTGSVLASRTNDFIFMTHNDIDWAFTVRKVDDILLPVQTFADPQYYSSFKRQFFLDADQNKIIEVGGYAMQRFKVNTDGTLDSTYYKLTTVNGGLVPYWSQMPIAPNGSYFIPNLSGAIYDQDLNVVNRIAPEAEKTVVDFCFSPDNNFVYVVDWGFSPEFATRIRKINILTLEAVDFITFTEIIPKRLVLNANDELVLWYSNAFGGSTFSYKTLHF